MSFSNGRQYLATPGPSIIPDQVLRAMQRPAPDIYKGEIIDITENIKKDISNFAETTGETVIYISNGHGVWEASLVNLFIGSSALQFAISVIGVLVFVGLTAYDTQTIKNMYYEGDSDSVSGKKALMGALRLYLDFINLFIMLLRLFGQRR